MSKPNDTNTKSRTRTIAFRATDDERRAIEVGARNADKSVADYIKTAALEAARGDQLGKRLEDKIDHLMVHTLAILRKEQNHFADLLVKALEEAAREGTSPKARA